jgi:hypothetical protein
MATFHLTFFVALHSVGGVASTATPLPSPRQCPQFSARADELPIKLNTIKAKKQFRTIHSNQKMQTDWA